MQKATILTALLLMALVLPMLQAQSVFTPNIISNTIYQNTNSSLLYLYATSNTLQAYIGSNTSNLSQVANLTSAYNTITTLIIPPKWYYKIIFTTAYFKAYNISTPSYLISIPQTVIPQYAFPAELFFAIGLLLSITMLLFVFRLGGPKPSLLAGITGFAIGMTAVILILFSLQYTTTLTTSAYTINAITSQLSVSSATAVSTPLATNKLIGTLAYAFALLDIFTSLIYLFEAGFLWNIRNRNKKYEK
ncbi:MAG: hypothetical protein QW575_08635 [Thermoproteota archaeon]